MISRKTNSNQLYLMYLPFVHKMLYYFK